MRLRLFMLLALCAVLFCACDAEKGKVEEMTKQFVNVVNAKDKAAVYDMYPGIRQISNMTLPESIEKGEITVKKTEAGLYVASIDNVRQQKLVFKVKDNNKIVLVQSFSIMDLDPAALELAIKTGVPVKQMPDVALSKLMDEDGKYVKYLCAQYPEVVRGKYTSRSPIGTLLQYVKFSGTEYKDYRKSAPQDASSQDMEESVSEHVLNMNLRGWLGGSSDATFYYNGTTDDGELTFTLSGQMNVRKLKLGSYDRSTHRLVMQEYFTNGNYVGDFEGTWENGMYQGVFTNTNGHCIDFKLQ